MTRPPMNEFTPITTQSVASLMLANMVLEYPTPDDAQVILLEREEDHRAWTEQFGKDIVAASKRRRNGRK